MRPSWRRCRCISESEPHLSETWMIVGAAAEGPMKLALVGRDRQVVDAGVTNAHQAVLVELPIFVAIGTKPVAGVVVTFVCEAHGDAVAGERPEFFGEAVVELAIPLARQKGDDLLAAVEKL